jgi:hypothetical protein
MKATKATIAAMLSLAFVVTLAYGIAQTIFASDTGFKAPTVTGTTVNTWTNPSNAYASDDVRATALGNRLGNKLQDYSGFDFSGIPAGATIDGIEVTVEAQGNATSASFPVVDLSWNGGSSWTSTKSGSTFPSGTDATDTLGGAADTWGRTWSTSELASGTFMFRMYAAGGSSRDTLVDAIQVKVYYTASAGPTVSTNAATSVAGTTATLNGQITATGGAAASTCGFAYSTNSTVSSGVSTTTDSTCPGSTGSFTKNLTGLTAGTTYYFRAYATNANGTGYGGILNFTPQTSSCTYSGSGDWNVQYTDNCYLTGTTYVSGICYFNFNGAGSFSLAGTLACKEVRGAAGFKIQGKNSSASLQFHN